MPVQNDLSKLGEFSFIHQIRHLFKNVPEGIVGIGDDCAVINGSGQEKILVTTDMLVEGVHFTLKMPPSAIGRKALACSLSDIAAMGGIPTFALISLGVPKNVRASLLNGIYNGIKDLARKFSVHIIGGDTVSSKELVINVTLLGKAKASEIVYRGNAQVNDQIFVTGPLGNSLKSEHHLYFNPRVSKARWLVENFKPSAMIDVSDGLAADLGHILEESKVGAILFEKNIPLRENATLTNALYDGEDFELLFTVSKQKGDKLKSPQFYRIGEITSKKGALSMKRASEKIENISIKGYTHF